MKWHAWLVAMALFGGLAARPSPGQTTAPPTRDSPGPASSPAEAAASTRERLGLAMATPYVRGKIPVVFIHGLWMSPSAWDKLIAEFRADPALDEQFQFWAFGYSTGDPIPYAALLLRRSLQEARRKLDPGRTDAAFGQMILVGHSMGGLLAKMMVVDSGDHLWRVVSPRRVDELQGDQGDVADLTQALVLAPHPDVRRVVYIATPHAGSSVDSGPLHRIGNRFVRLSDLLVGIHRRLALRNGPHFFHTYFYQGLPTSVEELKVNGPLLTSLHELPVAPGIQAHSIIAVRADSPPGAPGDGLVTAQSARIAGVASEKVVSCPHLLCFENAEVRAELRRILREHHAAR